MHVRNIDIRYHDLGVVERLYLGDHGELARVRFGPGATSEQWSAARRETARLGFDVAELEHAAALVRGWPGASPSPRVSALPTPAPRLNIEPSAVATEASPPWWRRLADRAFGRGSKWAPALHGDFTRAPTPITKHEAAPVAPPRSGIRVVEEMAEPLSPEAAAFEARIDPAVIYEKWNAQMNPGRSKKRAQEDD